MSKLENDLAALTSAFPTVRIGANRDHFIIPDFPMPPAIYQQPARRLLICIPPPYPTAPPDNFYVEWGLSLSSGATIANYSGPVALFGETWGQFSHHVEPSAWHVVPDPSHGDNFLTYLATVVARLQEGA